MKLTPEFVDKIVELFINAFNGDMIFLDKHMAFDHMGWFEIEFRYLPLEYDVIFESDRNLFCIDIVDGEGAKNTLYRIEKFDTETNLENIKIALQKLKNVLDINDFCFYIIRNEKLFRKKNQQYVRVKDLTELY